MRMVALFTDGFTLVYTEAVLLIYNCESQSVVFDAVLYQGMRTDYYVAFMGFDALMRLTFLRCGERSRQQLNSHIKRRQHLCKVLIMLLRQHVGRCHDACLIALFYAGKYGEHRDNGLARADITLYHARHQRIRRQIPAYLTVDFFLSAGKSVRQ